MNITSGVVAKAQKIIEYGPEGVGKTTLASQSPDPLFIDTEGSTNNMDVKRLDKPASWSMLLQQIDWVKLNKPCATLVIDTIDWAERLCVQHVCSSHGKTGIEDFGYGNGYTYVSEEFGKLLNRLQDLVDSGINVVLTAHAQIKKFEQPDEMGAYDRWELKLGKKTTSQTAPLVKEWADAVLFCNYKTMSIATDDKGKKFKGQGGKRVIYTSHHPAWDAKNRFGLPDEVDMAYANIASIFNANLNPVQQPVTHQQAEPPINNWQENSVPNVPQTSTEILPEPMKQAELAPDFGRDAIDYSGISQNLVDLMKVNNVIPAEIMLATESKGYYPAGTPIANYDQGYVDGVLVAAWPQVFNMIKEIRNQQQF
ncbi:ATP-binding protein [Enterococcus italicus]|uniref:ATP-binding protein n=1 Tax=Enterococcus italicus TaxID=246144 RepID=UPI0028B15207|nr:ATP-binding protein [Enterococcus italicus]